MSSGTFEGSLRDLLVAEVPATVWSRSLAAALSGGAVDPGEELVPDAGGLPAAADGPVDAGSTAGDEDRSGDDAPDAPADEPTGSDTPADGVVTSDPSGDGWSGADEVPGSTSPF